MSKPLATAETAATDDEDFAVARASAHAVLADTPEFRRAVLRNPALRGRAESILADLSSDDAAALARVLLASVPGAVPRGAASYGRPVEAEQRARELAPELDRFAAANGGTRSQTSRRKTGLAIAEIARLLPPSLGVEAPPRARAKAILKRFRMEGRGAKERP